MTLFPVWLLERRGITLLSIEEIRLTYMPDKMTILFVGESAPTQGTFFYTKDSLCTYTREAFELAFPEHVPTRSGDFLRFFQKTGCYLDDLSLVPIDKREAEERRRLQLEGLPGLTRRMRQYKPQAIVCMLKDKTLQAIIKEAARRADLDNVPFRVTSFGGNGNQGVYRQELKQHLLEFQQLGILRLP
jgi:hypothetical protein